MLTRTAPAKINLGLEVLRRRPDGYHDINTIFATVDLVDRLSIRPRTDSKITCRVLGDERLATEGGEENLCARAARHLLEEGGVDRGVDIVLDKRIPTGAGLGGGSSDAAETLLAVREIFAIDVEDDRLREIGLQLGSDVPFFVDGGVALGGGQGEVLTPIDITLPWHLLLVNPGVHVPTPEAYRLIGRSDERPASDLVEIVRRGVDDPSILTNRLANDFQKPVFARWPEVAGVHKRLTAQTGVLFAGMSGSGSTLFGLFATRGDAERGAKEFGERFTHVGGFHRP